MFLKSLVIFLAMLVTIVFSHAFKPQDFLSKRYESVSFEEIIPARFLGWQEIVGQGAQVIDPDETDSLVRAYTETVSRAYQHDSGNSVMISVAYNNGENRKVLFHYPEICYFAQGFNILEKKDSVIATRFGDLYAVRLDTQNGPRRELVTYWLMVGQNNIQSKYDKRMTELKYGLNGLIPDALVFRVSSISDDKHNAFSLHEQFVAELLKSVDFKVRLRLAGFSESQSMSQNF